MTLVSTQRAFCGRAQLTQYKVAQTYISFQFKYACKNLPLRRKIHLHADKVSGLIKSNFGSLCGDKRILLESGKKFALARLKKLQYGWNFTHFSNLRTYCYTYPMILWVPCFSMFSHLLCWCHEGKLFLNLWTLVGSLYSAKDFSLLLMAIVVTENSLSEF